MRRRGEEQATDIKSNNPHLAGGEKKHIASKGVKELLCSRAGYDVRYFNARCSAQAAGLKLKWHVRGTKNTRASGQKS